MNKKKQDEIANMVADKVEELLKKDNILYFREGTVFTTTDTNLILNYQFEATKELVNTKKITVEDFKKAYQ